MGKNNKKKHKKNKEKTVCEFEDVQTEEKDEGTMAEEDHTSINPEKRHIEDESDNEDKPRRKKKKNPILPTDTDNKKGKKSIRQMKREKHAQRQAEVQFAAKDQLKSQCLSYLSQWKHDRKNWKFMKVKQGWLFRNKFSSSLLPDSSWPVFLEYFESAQGNIKKLLLEDANKVIKQMDEFTESLKNKDKNEEQKEEETINKPDDVAYNRARDIIQSLH